MRGVTRRALGHDSEASALRVRPAPRYLHFRHFLAPPPHAGQAPAAAGSAFRTPFCALGLAVALSACQSSGTRPDPALTAVDAADAAALTPIEIPYVPLRDPVVEQSDLLARLRGGFTWPEEPARTAIARQLDWYTHHQQYLDRVFQRADLYLYYIVDELERRDMPAELALLPIVESAFDPFAYSDGRAAGLWQFIPGTGKRFGLEQNGGSTAGATCSNRPARRSIISRRCTSSSAIGYSRSPVTTRAKAMCSARSSARRRRASPGTSVGVSANICLPRRKPTCRGC